MGALLRARVGTRGRRLARHPRAARGDALPDAAALLASADVVVVTPWYEPFGMVSLEAMACGRPLVGTAVGGLLDSVDDGVTGLLVPPGDQAAVTRAVTDLLDDRDRAEAMGVAARRRVETLFSWDGVVDATLDAYAAAARSAAPRTAGDTAPATGWLESHLGGLRAALDDVARHGPTLDRWAGRLTARLLEGGRLLAAGNGGSAAEAQHFTAEFVGRFIEDRRPVSAIALTSDLSGLTAIGNDYGYAEVFARQVEAHAAPGDILVLLSTSGTSENVIAAARRARERGVTTWALTGGGPNPLEQECDESIRVASCHTAVIQECHLVLLHALAAAVDARLPRSREVDNAR